MNISVSGRGRKRNRRAPSIYYSPERAESGNKVNWHLFWLFFKLAAPLVAAAYIIYLSPVFKVKEVVISGNEYVTNGDVLISAPLGSNIFKLKTVEVENNIKSRLPAIKEVKVYKGIPNALKIVVEEHKGALTWQSGINYYLVSESGIVYRDITSDLTTYVDYPKVNDNRSLPVKISSRIVSRTFIEFVQRIHSQVKTEANLDPDYFVIDETTVDVVLLTKNGLHIKFDSLRSADKQLSDLKLVLMEKRQEISEYIDLRVNGWAYYK